MMHELNSKLPKNFDHRALLMAVKIFAEALDVFGSIAEMRKFVDDHKSKQMSVFDYDWTDTIDSKTRFKNTFACVLGSVFHKRYLKDLKQYKLVSKWLTNHLEDDNKFKQQLLAELPKHLDFVEKLFITLNGAMMEGSRRYNILFPDATYHNVCNLFHPCMLLFNHSCDPNMVYQCVDSSKQMFIVNRPLKAGSQLFMTVTSNEYYDRQSELILDGRNICDFEFTGTCMPCKFKWRASIDFKYSFKMPTGIPFSYSHPERNLVKTADGVVTAYDKHLQETCDYINENFEGYEQSDPVRKRIITKFLHLKKNIDLRNLPFSLLYSENKPK